MSHLFDLTISKLLASNTSNVGRLARLTAWLGVGKGLIQRIVKLNNKQGRKIGKTHWIFKSIYGGEVGKALQLDKMGHIVADLQRGSHGAGHEGGLVAE